MAEALSRDPYKNFRFKVYFDNETGSPVAGVNKVSGLSWNVDVFMHGVKRKVPQKLKEFPPVTLNRGITTDEKFQKWAESMWNWTQTNPLKGLRKDRIYIFLCDENGKKVVKYTLENCWVSSYKTLPELSADDNSIAIESITVEHEGWKRDVLGGKKSGEKKDELKDGRDAWPNGIKPLQKK